MGKRLVAWSYTRLATPDERSEFDVAYLSVWLGNRDQAWVWRRVIWARPYSDGRIFSNLERW